MERGLEAKLRKPSPLKQFLKERDMNCDALLPLLEHVQMILFCPDGQYKSAKFSPTRFGIVSDGNCNLEAQV